VLYHAGERTVGYDGFVICSVPWLPSRCVGSIFDYAQSNCGVVVLQKEDALRQYLRIKHDPVEAPWAARDTNNEPRDEFVHRYSVV
jgi:hypothetical protein